MARLRMLLSEPWWSNGLEFLAEGFPGPCGVLLCVGLLSWELKKGPVESSALHVALERGLRGTVQLLLQSGAAAGGTQYRSRHMYGSSEETPLCCAARGGDPELVALLLEHRAEVNGFQSSQVSAGGSPSQRTPLFCAVDLGRRAAVEATGHVAWEQLEDSLRGALHFLATNGPKLATVRASGPALLPPAQDWDEASGSSCGKMTLVLDLDETLAHCSLDPSAFGYDFSVRFVESKATGYMFVRPFARLFLEVAAQLFEVVTFTASSQGYADQVLDRLDPDGKCISKRLYRQHCTEVAGAFLKDMRRLGRPLERVILVDNSPVSLGLCLDNGIAVSSWTGPPLGGSFPSADRELLELLLVLQQCLASQASVTDFLAQRYGLRELVEFLQHHPELLGIAGGARR
ncbi:unnamed protein product [Polarella glacialis]|uniref:FCP1 homology domain-containing protein n=1 Tax=Polarella glacialis TaxID=89957 RepID=A0A813IZK9_POLGL|nr:unnamed protein product [Polarella glacialis]